MHKRPAAPNQITGTPVVIQKTADTARSDPRESLHGQANAPYVRFPSTSAAISSSDFR